MHEAGLMPFASASYLAQVRRLRNLAEIAVQKFPIRVHKIHFINHGENGTFRVEAAGGKNFLLRIHRNDYHTSDAILEELHWLKHLSETTDLKTPVPVASKNGRYVIEVEHGAVGKRNCVLFRWLDARFIDKSLSEKHMRSLGKTIHTLHENTAALKIDHRRYWTAEGLIGPDPKWGRVDNLVGIKAKDQATISEARRIIFSKMRAFEKKYPKRSTLIHADLHFGNVLSAGKDLALIDFDDCGIGFKAYDLVIPYASAVHALRTRKQEDRLPKFKEALLGAYAELHGWDKADDEAFRALVCARRIAQIGWLQSRSDNPRLAKFLPTAVKRALDDIKREKFF